MPDSAARYATEMLAKNADDDSWNYGNVAHDANQILGLAALQKGQIASAKEYLLAITEAGSLFGRTGWVTGTAF